MTLTYADIYKVCYEAPSGNGEAMVFLEATSVGDAITRFSAWYRDRVGDGLEPLVYSVAHDCEFRRVEI